ncbi:unnamed protein product [Rotaria magnacalcarata]|nr:unnamed protein product [Rotaria magnacalcarata]CAF3770903.1 unnamed protein product [Rotaria magnacalcarata]CAF3785718.1 unnamed protein product [Rotaria magnacalcarata]CAF3794184.1 unnamed protein product [Rotaria magnacalcarata]CAF3807206.1 unnamed protein product [Rotaria magnacalcarata]
MIKQSEKHSKCQYQADKAWLDIQYDSNNDVIRPLELEKQMEDPPSRIDSDLLDQICGSMIGMALGDTLGAHVEFQPHKYLVRHPVTELMGGGTWGLNKGEFTDDTSMAICLASSLIARRNYVAYDQLTRYKWWYRDGYMSSVGYCFDIGTATKESLKTFESRQKKFAKKHNIPLDHLDYLSDPDLLKEFDVKCSKKDSAGNGALMRLAPLALFFHKDPSKAVELSGQSALTTHSDQKAVDACRYYAALIVGALHRRKKKDLLAETFYSKHKRWFNNIPLHSDIQSIADGSFKKDGYREGIRGKGFVTNSLEAALWAFWSDEGDFRKGALAAVNLGDDTDTTAAIYGQLAGVYYGYKNLPSDWIEQLYAKEFIRSLSKWIAYEGSYWSSEAPASISTSEHDKQSHFEISQNPSTHPEVEKSPTDAPKSTERKPYVKLELSSKLESLKDHHPDYILQRNTIIDSYLTVTSDSNDLTTTASSKSLQHDKHTSTRQGSFIHDNYESCEDVRKWLKSLGKEYKKYIEIFRKNHVDGYWLLNHIDDKTLNEYGIDSSTHRQIIMTNIEYLKKKCRTNNSIDSQT